MSENNYADRGSIKIASGLNYATITQPHDTVQRKIDLDVTAGGHLRGFIQPTSDTEVIALRAAKKQIRAGTYAPKLPDYAELQYREVPNRDGVLVKVAEFVYPHISMGDGTPLTMPAGTASVFLYNHLDELEGKPITKGERAAFSGFACDLDGNLTEPAAWRRQGKDGALFYSGDNRAHDKDRYLAARVKGGNEQAVDREAPVHEV